jgi:hypothetical protein
MKLKKKMMTIYIQRVRSPHGMSLKEYTSFYSKLMKKYEGRSGLKIVSRSTYYSDGGYWLMERRMETDAELGKRQAVVDKRLAAREVERVRDKASRKAYADKRKIEMKKQKEAVKKANMERQVERVKTMVKVLQLAGYEISKSKALAARG